MRLQFAKVMVTREEKAETSESHAVLCQRFAKWVKLWEDLINSFVNNFYVAAQIPRVKRSVGRGFLFYGATSVYVLCYENIFQKCRNVLQLTVTYRE